MIFGRQTHGVINGKPFYTMNGVVPMIKTNSQAQGSDISWDDLTEFLESVFRFNIKGMPNERIAFCGNKVLQILAQMAAENAHINITPTTTEFGLKINQWISPFGNITLMSHPLFVENPVWTKNLLVLHPGAMKTRWLRKTMPDDYERAGTRAGKDADFGVLTSEMTIEYHAEKTAGYFTGIDTLAA